MRTEVFSAALESSLTVWWDQPDQAPQNARYTVLLDGKPIGETDRTHAEITALQPETSYCIQVCLGDEPIGEITAATGAPVI